MPRPRFSLRTLAIFLLLVTAGMGLWFHWGAWVLQSVFVLPAETVYIGFSEDSAELWVDLEKKAPDGSVERRWREARDPWTGEESGSGPHAFDDPGSRLYEVLPDDSREVALMTSHDAGGNVVFQIGLCDKASDTEIAFFSDGVAFESTFGLSPDANWVAVLVGDTARIWRRRRPEWWWGVFYLKELWATALFAVLFVRSILRDRRMLAARTTGPVE